MFGGSALCWDDTQLGFRLREVHDLLLVERWEARCNGWMCGLHPSTIHIVWVGGKLVHLSKLSCHRVAVLLHGPLGNCVC